MFKIQNMLLFCLHFLPDVPKLKLLSFATYISATYWRCGGKCHMGSVGNLPGFPEVK